MRCKHHLQIKPNKAKKLFRSRLKHLYPKKLQTSNKSNQTKKPLVTKWFPSYISLHNNTTIKAKFDGIDPIKKPVVFLSQPQRLLSVATGDRFVSALHLHIHFH